MGASGNGEHTKFCTLIQNENVKWTIRFREALSDKAISSCQVYLNGLVSDPQSPSSSLRPNWSFQACTACRNHGHLVDTHGKHIYISNRQHMREMQRCVKINRSHTHILYIHIQRERDRDQVWSSTVWFLYLSTLSQQVLFISVHPWDSSDIIRHRDSPTVKAKKSRPTTAKTYQGPSPRYSPGWGMELLRDGYWNAYGNGNCWGWFHLDLTMI